MKDRKLFCRLTAVILLNIALILTFQALTGSRAASYRQGSTGAEVRTIQTKLKRWGYYTGNIDGVYGSQTAAAVRRFQQTNGLTVDGICGPKTLAAMGISSAGTSAREDDLYLLSRMISAEARGEPYAGQVSVGAVILNRVDHPSFPNTVAGVIYQAGAFSSMTDGNYATVTITDTARRAAQDALNGSDPTGGAIYFYNPATSTNKWILSRPVVCTIGKHVFAK
ncbi:MAG: spore cortex-lytic enzyme [Clostridiaceae bacterium]|nr:spore cortex-lytic enzyme [Clostridiaceae bacterium]